MRKFLMTAACAAALTLSACDTKESYQVPVRDAWAKVSSNGYAAGAFGTPSGLLAQDVRASFESFPGDRTGYWKFTRKGKELGRVNFAVEGDDASSTVSYSYAQGEIAEEDKKVEQEIRKYSQRLLVEAIDSQIENRERNQKMKDMADAQTAMALMGDMMKEANASMDKAIAEMKAGEKQGFGELNARTAKYTSTTPTTNLTGY